MPPVYQDMIDEIRQTIRSGQVSGGEKFSTEVALVRKTGLSMVSVRRAVDVLVRDGLLERRAGKGLYVMQEQVWTKQLQMVVPGLDDSYVMWSSVAEGCRAAAARERVCVQIYSAAGSLDEDIHLIESLPDSKMDGAIITSLPHPRFTQALYKLADCKMPVVLLDDVLDGSDISSVMVDHYQGAYQITEQLIGKGHRRIGFIGRLTSGTIKRRVEGLRDAVADNGLPLDRNLLLDLGVENPLSDWVAEIDRCTRVLMNRKDPPTAIFYSCDNVAAHGYRTLKQLGLRIPEDVSVVGFDGAPVSQWLEPQLATMKQPCQEMGHKAVQILLAMLAGNTREQARQIVLPPVWVDGASIAQVGTKSV